MVIVPCSCSYPIKDVLQQLYIKHNKKPGFTSQQTQGKYKTKL